MKIKTFSSEDAGSISGMDVDVNNWMEKNKTSQIVNMFHRTVPSTSIGDSTAVVITIIYRELVSPATDKTPAVYA